MGCEAWRRETSTKSRRVTRCRAQLCATCSSTYDRWFSPDPAGKEAVHPDDPQTWNAYAYAGNNPTTNTDPDGEDYYLLGGEACGTDNVQCDKQGYVLDQSGSRQVITDQQVLNGEVGSTVGQNGVNTITTGQGTFQAQFFDPQP